MDRYSDYLLDPRFLSERKLLVPCLAHAVARSKNIQLPLDVKGAVLECLVVKAESGAAHCQQDLVEAQQLLEGDDRLPKYLHAALTHRQSVLARLNADYTASCNLIDAYMSKSVMDCRADRRAHAWHLRLFVSRLKNLCLQERFEEAHDEIKRWNILVMPSLMERQVVISFSLIASEIERSLGRLEQSKAYLEDCYNFPLLLSSDSNRYQIVCALVDIRCALMELDEAESMIKIELAKLPSIDRLSKAQRRLLVSSLDVDIARMSESSFAHARSTISQLNDLFDNMGSQDISDQLLHIRTLTASARILHLQSLFIQAIEEWERIKVLAKKYSAFRDKGFTFAFSQFSIGCAHAQIAGVSDNSRQQYQQHTQAALEAIEEANSIFRTEKDNYWIPMVTTDWLPKRRLEIANWLHSTGLT